MFEIGRAFACALLAIVALAAAPSRIFAAPSRTIADLAYRHGYIYTVDSQNSVQQALAIHGGRIVYVGGDLGLEPFIGPKTHVVDLQGRMLMPGLVDGHMHPLEGGAALLKCSLNYEQLRIDQLQAKIQACLDQSGGREPDGWLEVVNWFQEGMLPAGVATNRGTLDTLKTKRPLIVISSFGHTALVNSRAIDLAGITAKTEDPLGGKVARDALGAPTGILDDAAQDLVTRLLPKPTLNDDLKSASAALDAMRRQGITTFLDAMAEPPSLVAFSELQRRGKLSARAHFALLITPAEGRDPHKAVAAAAALAARYDQGEITPRPGITVRNVKLFLDGVISAPALSGAMIQPYLAPSQASAGAAWAPSQNRGPDVYFAAAVLRSLLIDVADAGLEPHMHADGDRAVREGLNGIQALREAFPGKDIRAALAHDEIVHPADFSRFASLDAVPVLSFQWEKPASDTIDNAREYLGPSRFKYIEPAGVLAAAGARIAYGSDWPVDPLDEWFALKVGVARTNRPRGPPAYAGRLSEDPGLTRDAVLRAITLNSSYELHQEALTGSLENGKLADLIVLDRNVKEVPVEEIAQVKVLQTIVGGRIVFDATALQ